MKKSPSAKGGQGLKNSSAPSTPNKCIKSLGPSTTKARRSQRATTRRSSPRAARREVAVYDGVDLLGTIMIAADGKSTAYTAGGKRLGIFTSLQLAFTAFNKSSVSGGVT
jgi:hypothetical protein